MIDNNSLNFDFEFIVILIYLLAVIVYSLLEFFLIKYTEENFRCISKFFFFSSLLIIFIFTEIVCRFFCLVKFFFLSFFLGVLTFFLFIFLILFFFTEKNISIYKYFVFLHLNFILILLNYNLLILFISLEILTYIIFLFFVLKKDKRSVVVLRNFFVVNVINSLLFLYALYSLYSNFGSLDLKEISLLLNLLIMNDSFSLSINMLIPFFCFFVVFGIKLLVFPFQFWAFDVYTWTKNTSYAFLLVVPKIFYLFFLIKISFFFLTIFSLEIFKQFLVLVGFFSLIFGYSLAIYTNNIKRLLIYTSTASSGFYFILISSFDNFASQNLKILLIYFFINLFCAHLIYIYLVILYKDFILVSDLKSLYKDSPILTYLFILLFFSYAGFPPFLLFFVKIFFVFFTFKLNNLLIIYLIFYILIWAPFFYFRIFKVIFSTDRAPISLLGFFYRKNLVFLFIFLLFMYLILLFNIDYLLFLLIKI